ncbi:hypothetical protein MXB_5670 [Myxobolus squamalis]|nr:hypothetical protein MXB_5670 [Myxobolus squamalis]
MGGKIFFWNLFPNIFSSYCRTEMIFAEFRILKNLAHLGQIYLFL